MTLFMIVKPCLLPQFSERKKDKGEKYMKNVKPLREVKITIFIVGEARYLVLQLRVLN